MVGDPLDGGQVVVIVVTDHGRARQQPDIVPVLQFFSDGRRPVRARRIVDALAAAQQAAAKGRLLVGQDDPRAGGRCRPRGGEAGRTAADDQHVAMGVHLVVAVGVGLLGRAAHAGGMPDHDLIGLPEALRPHEGLVVEAGRKQPAKRVVHSPHVEFQ